MLVINVYLESFVLQRSMIYFAAKIRLITNLNIGWKIVRVRSCLCIQAAYMYIRPDTVRVMHTHTHTCTQTRSSHSGS